MKPVPDGRSAPRLLCTTTLRTPESRIAVTMASLSRACSARKSGALWL
jgi:hypothetical protein